MLIPKNLFRYDLAIVAIMKCEAPYIKEWLDYHLLAGVDHFFIYDNDSPDNQAQIVKPYVNAGLVDYIPLPGKAMQLVAYNDAINRFKFRCRYMAFIDGDEFIFPKTDQSIVEVIDETLSDTDKIAGLSVHWQHFGSSGQDKADYSRGVLERFTQRAPKNWHGNIVVKTICNPRLVSFFNNAHYANFFRGYRSASESGNVGLGARRNPIQFDKIVINHYHCKSREEYSQRKTRGSVLKFHSDKYCDATFDKYDQNQEFDDGILKYRDARAKIYQPPSSREVQINEKTLLDNADKMEVLLTCLFSAPQLQEQSLNAILKLLAGEPTLTDIQFLFKSLPEILSLDYPAVADVKKLAAKHIPMLISDAHAHSEWQRYSALDCLQRFLKGVD